MIEPRGPMIGVRLPAPIHSAVVALAERESAAHGVDVPVSRMVRTLIAEALAARAVALRHAAEDHTVQHFHQYPPE